LTNEEEVFRADDKNQKVTVFGLEVAKAKAAQVCIYLDGKEIPLVWSEIKVTIKRE
jgi:hypothetical protein